MKIDDSNYDYRLKRKENGKVRQNSVKGSEKSNFKKELSDFNQELVKEKFDKLLSIVDDQGKKLKKSLDKRDLLEYKKRVKKFLRLIQKEFAHMKQSFSWDDTGNVRTYKIIEKVDENLETLHNLFFEEQDDVLQIVKKIDEIRGLLLDLYI